MSDLLSIFINVKYRLESLLGLCRINEHPIWINDNDSGELYRFCGPYHSDIEELESSIVSISTLIDKFQHELNVNDDFRPIRNYSLCKNGWTLEEIERLNNEEQCLNLEILGLLRLQTLGACINKLDEGRCLKRTRGLKNEKSILHDHVHFNTTSSSIIIPIYDMNKALVDLPPELLLHIFSFISPCELISNIAPTCQLFANLILTRHYAHLDLSKLISIFDVPRLFNHLPYLHSITFIDWENDLSMLTWSIWFNILSKTASNLRTIRFRNVLLSPILISLLIEYFPHCLQTITFDCQQHKTYEKFDLILCLLGDKNIKIQNITASYQLGITNFGILQLVNNLHKLVELNLVYIEAINDETIKALCNKHKNHLEILKIDGAQLTDKALDSISESRRLRSIMIEFCINMTGSNFNIFQNFHHLEELCLGKLNNIPSESFQLLFNENYIFKNLINLKLGECHLIDDTCIQSIIKSCPHLIDMTCSWAYGVTDDGFNEIVMRCHHLRRLSLIGCYQIYGEILNDVPEKYFKYIEYLNFEQCNQIEDEILNELYRRKKSILIVDYYGSVVDEEEEE